MGKDAIEAAVEAAMMAGQEDPETAGTPGTVIQDTDIVFDCPHCGHNLAIDYRGAGLQINCVNCGESVLVPIPEGMEIDDLDIEPGEILKQLFATRRNLQKAELAADDLRARLEEANQRLESSEARFASFQMQLGEMRQLCLQQVTANAKLAAMLDRFDAAAERPAENAAAAAGE